jgi:energy-coupling factor transporter ATP-binding protein EcfA2
MADSARPLLGRGPELARIARAIDDLTASRGNVLFLVGEPGIGKSRLADEIASQARARGSLVAWGRSWDGGGAPAYWPWTQILETLLQGLTAQALVAAIGDSARLLPPLVPDLRSHVRAVRSDPDRAQARFALFQAAARLLRWRSQSQPLVLLLDDLHAADHASILLLDFLARELSAVPVLLVACHRDVEAHMSPEVEAALARASRDVDRLLLRRLDRAETAALIEQAAAGLGNEATSAVFEATQGNPLFVDQTLKLLSSEQARAAGSLPVMYGVRELLRRRLRSLSEPARAALAVASVVGEQFSLALLAEASGQPADQLLDLMAEATALATLVERPERRYQFSHALIREVVYRDLPRSQRLQLHAAVGRALERVHADDLDAPYAEIAHHFLDAAPAELEAGPRYALKAAVQALERFAWEDAAAVLERARVALELAPNLGQLRGEVLLALGLARIRAGDVDTGKRLCQQAAELARRHADGPLLARVALAYGAEITAAIIDPALVKLLEEALACLPEAEPALTARVKARLAAAMQPSEEPQVPIALAREAIALARGLGDRTTVLEVLHDAMAALMDYVPADERLPLNLEVESLASEMEDPIRALRANQRLVIDHLERGELAMADARIAACDRLGRELPQLRQHWRFPLLRAVRAAFEGRFADADRLATEAEATAAGLGLHPRASLLLHGYVVRRLAERDDEALALEPELLASWTGLRVAEEFATMLLAATRARLGDLGEARARLAQIPPGSFVFGHHEPCTMAELGEVVVALDDRERAGPLYDRLSPLAGRLRCIGLAGPSCDGAYDEVLGALAFTLGRPEAGFRHLEAAVADLERLGGRPALARAQYQLAVRLRARGRPDDLDRAARLLASATATAEALPLPRLLSVLRTGAPGPTVTTPAPQTLVPDVQQLSFDLRREGEVWSVSCNGRLARLKDSRSMRTLALLVSNPDREFHVLDLVSGGDPGPPDRARDLGDAGELLDGQARQSYQRRLAELRDTVAEAESLGDDHRAGRAREEIELLGAELSRALGIGGRQRRAGVAAERARVAVQRRVRDAIRRIAEAIPEAGRHLQWAVRTGGFCSYRPHGQR